MPPRRSPARPTRSTAAGPRSDLFPSPQWRARRRVLRSQRCARSRHLRVRGEGKADRSAARSSRRLNRAAAKKINLALQGGGAHGAFTWGVLDHLLDDERIDIEGISGTSAGAINAVMLADGLARGGADGSAQAPRRFLACREPRRQPAGLQRGVVDRLFSFTPYEGSPVQAWFDALARYFSPYDLNPLNINPLRDLIERFVDFDAVRACREIQPLHLGHQRAHRPPARLPAGEDHSRRRDGVGLPAVSVPRRRDRRRALLGRRLHGQSGDLPVLRRDRDRGRAGRADQPGRAAIDAK